MKELYILYGDSGSRALFVSRAWYLNMGLNESDLKLIWQAFDMATTTCFDILFMQGKLIIRKEIENDQHTGT